MNQKNFSIDVTKDRLTFSAAHFITFGDNICERLHGHNYSVRCEVAGGLNEHGYVVDFIALRDRLNEITSDLDHHVLLPTEHPTIAVRRGDGEVTATFEDRRWVFPEADCRLLPITNTTAELLASYIVDQMLVIKDQWYRDGITEILVAVDENQGQWGRCAVKI